ncbi:serine/threonine protein kinase [Baekduia soli]|uniref:serine/threonine protein kinase n=1 Tax=Baekduia soli TaxID=496014 RepID=UPI001651E0F4|nr:serine/threonine protein kinase [Baekduia soli]
MRNTRMVTVAVALIAVMALPAMAAAKANPYTAAGVCGPGFKPIDRHRLVDGNWGQLLSEVVLTYNASTGQNCVVNLKRYRVGQAEKYGDWLYAEVYTRPLTNPANLDSDQGNFKFFAGPVYVTARSKCVRWGGGADLLVPSNWSPRGEFHSAFRSGWTHCG